MKNLQLISVRLDPDDLEALKKFCDRHYYWKRNAVICGIISAVMRDFNDRQIYDMVRRNRFGAEHVTAEYRIEQVQAPEKTDPVESENIKEE